MTEQELRKLLIASYNTGSRNWLDNCLKDLNPDALSLHKETIRTFLKKDLDYDCNDAAQTLKAVSKKYFFVAKVAVCK